MLRLALQGKKVNYISEMSGRVTDFQVSVYKQILKVDLNTSMTRSQLLLFCAVCGTLGTGSFELVCSKALASEQAMYHKLRHEAMRHCSSPWVGLQRCVLR